MAEHFRIRMAKRRGRDCNFSQPTMDPFHSQASGDLEETLGDTSKASYFECASKPPCHPQATAIAIIPEYPIIIFFLRKRWFLHAQVNFSTSSWRRPRLPILPCHAGSHTCLSLLLPVLSSLPFLPPPTLSVTCPTHALQVPQHLSGLSHCTLAQSISSPHLPRTLGGSRVISTLNHTHHKTLLPNTQTHTTPNVSPTTSAHLYLSCPRPWSETLIWMHGNSCSLAPLLPSQNSFPVDLHEVILLTFHFSPLGIFLCFPVNEDILPAVQSLSSMNFLVSIFNPSYSHDV